jgi:hypothetical protein
VRPSAGARLREDGPVADGATAWVLAVDARAEPALTAVAGPAGARLLTSLDASAGLPPGVPLAVVAVHPASWDAARVDAHLAEVAARLGRAAWPVPVALPASEAAAWRALGLGLVPARGRLVALDPAMPEAAVVDRDGDLLASAGAVVAADRRADPAAAGPEDLVALARQALDAAPAGPPFAGVLIAGALPSVPPGADELPAVVARRTGHPPLLAGDPATSAVLGAAALGWAAATASASASASAASSARGSATATRAPASSEIFAAAPAGARPELPAGRRRRRPPWWLVVLALLVVVAGAAGLLQGRARSQPSPYTHTCPGDVVVAYSAECDKLAPSSVP